MDADNNSHRDMLGFLNDDMSLHDKLVRTHSVVRSFLPFIDRIAVALYDAGTGRLSTYVHSGPDNPLSNYEAALENVPSLKEIIENGLPRIINQPLTFEDEAAEHTVRIGRAGYAASYTLPMFANGEFTGFLFFNSKQKNVFDNATLAQVDVFGHLISLMVVAELQTSKTMAATVAATARLTHVRDPETGSHIDRMSRFAKLIARALAARYMLDDEYIEHVFMFAPLHDIGKIGIPDRILLKEGPLNPDELLLMRTHARLGREVIDGLLKEFNLDGLQHTEILRNIAEFHHESVDGSGYPAARQGDEIPLEARIVAVADVFDALTSRRPYKEAWSNERAFAFLQEMAGHKFDADCVAVLIAHRADVEEIQRQFRENPNG